MEESGQRQAIDRPASAWCEQECTRRAYKQGSRGQPDDNIHSTMTEFSSCSWVILGQDRPASHTLRDPPTEFTHRLTKGCTAVKSTVDARKLRCCLSKEKRVGCSR